MSSHLVPMVRCTIVILCLFGDCTSADPQSRIDVAVVDMSINLEAGFRVIHMVRGFSIVVGWPLILAVSHVDHGAQLQFDVEREGARFTYVEFQRKTNRAIA